MFIILGVPILLLNFLCDCKLYFEHTYQTEITRRLEKEEQVTLQSCTFKLLKKELRKRIAKRITDEDATTLVKEIRERMDIIPILKRVLMNAEFELQQTLKEFNSVKAVLNDCVLDHKGQRVILLPVLHSMLYQMKVQNKMKLI